MWAKCSNSQIWRVTLYPAYALYLWFQLSVHLYSVQNASKSMWTTFWFRNHNCESQPCHEVKEKVRWSWAVSDTTKMILMISTTRMTDTTCCIKSDKPQKPSDQLTESATQILSVLSDMNKNDCWKTLDIWVQGMKSDSSETLHFFHVWLN